MFYILFNLIELVEKESDITYGGKKMKKRKLSAIAVLLLIMTALPIVSAFEKNSGIENVLSERSVEKAAENDPEVLKKTIPESYEAIASLYPRINRFLLWTNNGINIMWGTYGKGYFRGEDNNDKKAWGIYGAKVFAGFYDGEFFYGRYRNHKWRATNLFNKNISFGEFETFPGPVVEPVARCKDSDKGHNYYKAGKVTSCIGNNCNRAKDYCIGNIVVRDTLLTNVQQLTTDVEKVNNKLLVETFCNADKSIGREKYECWEGCKRGACIIPKECPRLWDPVCGLKEVRCIRAPCPAMQKTYPNKCELEKDKARFLHKGECKDIAVEITEEEYLGIAAEI